VLKACVELPEPWTGGTVHAHVMKYGLEFVSVVRTGLMIIMYVKFGELGLADFLFGSMVDRDLVAWNALIAMCVQNGSATKVLGLFRQIGVAGIKPDAVTIVSGLSAFGQLGCLEIGEVSHRESRKEGIDCNIIVENARIDMFVKCRSIDMARTVFNKMPQSNVISWSTMILGYSINGEIEKELALFSRM
jgi:pentatricopeptide repeat protein